MDTLVQKFEELLKTRSMEDKILGKKWIEGQHRKGRSRRVLTVFNDLIDLAKEPSEFENLRAQIRTHVIEAGKECADGGLGGLIQLEMMIKLRKLVNVDMGIRYGDRLVDVLIQNIKSKAIDSVVDPGSRQNVHDIDAKRWAPHDCLAA